MAPRKNSLGDRAFRFCCAASHEFRGDYGRETEQVFHQQSREASEKKSVHPLTAFRSE
jgi:hypothetical protein